MRIRNIGLMILAAVNLFAFGIIVNPGYARIDVNVVTGFWLMEEDEDDVIRDSSGNGHDGEFVGNKLDRLLNSASVHPQFLYAIMSLGAAASSLLWPGMTMSDLCCWQPLSLSHVPSYTSITSVPAGVTAM